MCLHCSWQVVRVPAGFEVVEGVRLDKDYAIGKMIAGGNQGAIYELLDPKHKPTPQLLKVGAAPASALKHHCKQGSTARRYGNSAAGR